MIPKVDKFTDLQKSQNGVVGKRRSAFLSRQLFCCSKYCVAKKLNECQKPPAVPMK